MGVTSADREPERLRDIKTPSVGLSAQRTGHYQEKVEEDGDLPRILLDLGNIREEKLVSGCSSVVAMEKDLGLATVLEIHRTQSKEMRKPVVSDHV